MRHPPFVRWPNRAWRAPISVLVAWALGAAVARADDLPPTVIATIDRAPVPAERLSTALRETGVSLASLETEDRDRLKREILNEVINTELLLREARDRGIRVSDADVARAVAQARSDSGPDEFSAVLKERDLTVAEWEGRVREHLIVSRLLSTAVPLAPAPTEAELKTYYDRHPDEFIEGEAVDARQILVPSESAAGALRTLLLNGADFGQVATAYSTAPEASDGGHLGLVERGHLPEGFEVLFSLKPGEISPVIHTEFGYHLFTVSEHRPASRLTYRDVADTLRERLYRTRQENAVETWIGERRNRAVIVINEPLLAGFNGKP
ncbi:MAG: peptidyl-prolyl cis-trans isomerase [Nitrospirae bacterium]|nr:peptidyl-prolyl cis-trans isomerase [Nitrospirota bacterium]